MAKLTKKGLARLSEIEVGDGEASELETISSKLTGHVRQKNTKSLHHQPQHSWNWFRSFLAVLPEKLGTPVVGG